MLLHEAPSLRVDVVSWSPRGDWVAMSQFAAPQDWATWDGVGEMWLLRPQGDERISLGPTVATLVAWHATAPQWSRTGDRLAYLAGSQVLTDEGSAFDASLMIWEEKTGEVRTLLPVAARPYVPSPGAGRRSCCGWPRHRAQRRVCCLPPLLCHGAGA